MAYLTHFLWGMLNGALSVCALFFRDHFFSVSFPAIGNLQKLFLYLKHQILPSFLPTISLLCSCAKALEHIIFKHLSLFLEEHNLINDRQHGFRKGLYTITQLLETVHNIIYLFIYHNTHSARRHYSGVEKETKNQPIKQAKQNMYSEHFHTRTYTQKHYLTSVVV